MAASSAAFFLELKQLLSSLLQSCSTMLLLKCFVPKQSLSSAFATVVVLSTLASEPAATVDSLEAAESSAEPCSLNEAE